jgi:hypothetical protein
MWSLGTIVRGPIPSRSPTIKKEDFLPTGKDASKWIMKEEEEGEKQKEREENRQE